MAKSPVAILKAELAKLSPAELEKHRANVEAAIEKQNSKKMDEARAAAEKAAKQHGFSLNDIVGGAAPKKRGRKKAAAAAKYANPDDKSQTWSGRGRQPAWYKSRVEAGMDPAKMAV